MKIVVNKCYGGFSISKECAEFMARLGNEQAKTELVEWEQENEWIQHFLKTGTWPTDCPEDRKEHLVIDVKYHQMPTFYGYGYTKSFKNGYTRNSAELVQAVETLGKAANGRSAELEVVKIPDGVEWQIEEHDGQEWIAEKHRTW